MKGRELPGESTKGFTRDATDGEASLLLAALFLLFAFFRRHLGNLRNEVPHLANFLLGFFFGSGIDGIFDFGACGIHRFEFKTSHNKTPEEGIVKDYSSVTVSRMISSIVVRP